MSEQELRIAIKIAYRIVKRLESQGLNHGLAYEVVVDEYMMLVEKLDRTINRGK